MAARQAHRIFVGNLPWTVSKKELKEYFSQFGHVSTAFVAFNKETGLSKGYGFVKFTTRDGYVSATSKDTHSIEGNAASVQIANDRNSEELS